MNLADFLLMKNGNTVKPDADLFDILLAKKLSDTGVVTTITGNPLSFLVKKAQTAISTKISFTPQQDLHGYEYPWPAGGGKNKFSGVIYQADSNYDASGNIVSNENYNMYKCDLLSEGRNTISFYDSSTGQTGMTVRMRPYDSSDNPLSGTIITEKYSSTTDQIVRSFTIPEGTAYILFGLRKTTNTVQLESGSTASSYVPFSNICPISGRTSVSLTIKDGEQVTQDDITISFGETVYGGTLDVETGVLTVEWAYIASYDGEAISEPWISSIDRYVQGTYPSTGAEVAYKLVTPTTIQLTPSEVQLLKGVNNLWTDGDEIELTYKA